MDHARLQYQLRQSASLRLLQKETAPLIVSFLHREFKQAHRQAVPAAELTVQLEEYLEELQGEQPGAYPRAATVYLKQWCDEEHRLLRSYYASGNDDPFFELTPEAEKALGWFEDLQPTEFVGTESRLRRVFALLEEIVGRGAADAQTRLAQLEQQQALLQHEIDTIRRTGQVERLSETQLKERFLEANDVARRLLADFREVEQNFRQIAQTVQQAQLAHDAQKGAIVGYVLDADDALKQSDQGRSFYAFWEFLRSPSRQDALRSLLTTVYTMPELTQLGGEHALLKRLKSSLLEASDKVVQSNHRLAEQLRRLLDERNLAEGRRVRELIAEIKRLAAQSAEFFAETEFLPLDGAPALRLPLEKALWEPAAPVSFAGQTLAEADATLAEADLTALYRQFYIDEARLHERIEALLETRHEVTLAELTERFPIEQGLAEVLGYLQIAARSPEHRIEPEAHEQLSLNLGQLGHQSPAQISLPRVVYASRRSL